MCLFKYLIIFKFYWIQSIIKLQASGKVSRNAVEVRKTLLWKFDQVSSLFAGRILQWDRRFQNGRGLAIIILMFPLFFGGEHFQSWTFRLLKDRRTWTYQFWRSPFSYWEYSAKCRNNFMKFLNFSVDSQIKYKTLSY